MPLKIIANLLLGQANASKQAAPPEEKAKAPAPAAQPQAKAPAAPATPKAPESPEERERDSRTVKVGESVAPPDLESEKRLPH